MGGVSLKSRLLEPKSKKILYARLVSMILSFLLGILILAYTLYFFYVFQTLSNTTSYFPWAWEAYYKTSGPVIELTFVGILFSAVICSITGVGMLVFHRALRNYSRPGPSMNFPKTSGGIVLPRQPRRGAIGLDTPSLAALIALVLDIAGIGLALQSGEEGGSLLIAGVLIFVSLLVAGYFALDTFFPRKK
ncbi:MAG: hypothetical protein JRN20_07095 [Nitrososphaerota archaeon]|nr:hypothetical protein [Nitrososphaerota archaeon]